MRYSFDDMAIGIVDGPALRTREILRPKGLTRNAWYAHAQQVCKLLNSN